jgi:hypothetical protein
VAAECADDPGQPGQLAVRNGNAVTDRRAAQALALPQHLDQAAGVDLAVLPRQVLGELAQHGRFGRSGERRGDQRVGRQQVEDLHRYATSAIR